MRSARGNIVLGMFDILRDGYEMYYNSSHQNDMTYGRLSESALENADKLMREASNSSGFPEELKSEYAKRQLVNYMTDGYLDEDNSMATNQIIRKWGNLLLNNEKGILQGTYDFSPEGLMCVPISTGDGNTGRNYLAWFKVGNSSEELKEARKLLQGPLQKPNPTIRED